MAAPAQPAGRIGTAVGAVGQRVISGVTEIGGIATLVGESLLWFFRRPWRLKQLLLAMDEIGVGSSFIVLLTGFFTGAVLAVQGVYAFSKFNAESMVGASVAISLVRELSPVLTGLMVTGRAGSAIATEIGTMRVTEQIDALSSMAVNPVQYLIAPRIVAGVLMMPVLTMLFNGVGLGGSYAVAVGLEGLSAGTFTSRIARFVLAEDIVHGLWKSSLFGLAIVAIACFKGYNARGGAKGVGLATTEAVVMSSVAILVLDYLATTVSIQGLAE